jgi:hypothetical protein
MQYPERPAASGEREFHRTQDQWKQRMGYCLEHPFFAALLASKRLNQSSLSSTNPVNAKFGFNFPLHSQPELCHT